MTFYGNTVHPHARGERLRRHPGDLDGSGSSPRTWGTQTTGSEREITSRFIPTHVGNACQICGQMDSRSVHPHARGERCSAAKQIASAAGSSPRTWGTPHSSVILIRCFRFIPTHVGNAAGPDKSGTGKAVHPHARGERAMAGGSGRPRGGSSPRTWGTLIEQIAGGDGHRFIPTHVGNA